MPWLTPDAFGTRETLRLIRCNLDLVFPYFLAAMNGAIAELADEENWEQFGVLTQVECADYFFSVFSEYVNSDMIGTILPYVATACPLFALPCDGTSYARIDYPALYAAIDVAFHIDADNFRVPDLRGNFPLGVSASHAINTTGGAETHTLTVPEVPAHTHVDAGHTHLDAGHSHVDAGHVHAEIGATPSVITIGAGIPVPSGVPIPSVTGIGVASILTGFAAIQSGTANNQNTGGGSAHNNMPPFLAVKYCVVAL